MLHPHRPLTIRMWRYASLAVFLLASGCANITSSPLDHPHVVERHYHDNIDINGRLSVRYRQNDRDEALHGSFTWHQTARRIQLDLLSPLGQTLAQIDIQPGMASITQSGKESQFATDADTLTQQILDWPLPISGLRDWLQGFGRNANKQTFIATPMDTPSHFITHDGWNLNYGQWQTDGQYPKYIQLQRDTQQAGPVSIRLVIDNWQSQ